MRVAIVGSGIAGLAAAHRLNDVAEVTLFEAGRHFGGHAHTVDVTLPGPGGEVSFGVDTGFLVFNERTYPNLIGLLDELGVATSASEMSFSVQAPGAAPGRTLEWSGSSLATVFAQRSNLVDPRFLRMLADLLRFNALARRLAGEQMLMQPLGDFLDEHRFGRPFREWYLLPMLACIWSCPTGQMLRFPVATMLRFCHNHGLVQVRNRPQWRTVTGGARRYVEKIVCRIEDKRLATPVRRIHRDATGIRVATDGGVERFDRLVLAVHPDQALALLPDATLQEQAVLGSFRYQANRAVLHTDASMLPSRRAAWAAWNYERAPHGDREASRVCLHYFLNRLQPLPFSRPVLVSLNPVREIAGSQLLGEYEYAHPVFDAPAVRAQRHVEDLQGRRRTWFCGAWTGYGFHEDGLKSGLGAARQVAASLHAPMAQAA